MRFCYLFTVIRPHWAQDAMYLQFQDSILLVSRFLTSLFAGGLLLVLTISAIEAYATRRDPTSPRSLPPHHRPILQKAP